MVPFATLLLKYKYQNTIFEIFIFKIIQNTVYEAKIAPKRLLQSDWSCSLKEHDHIPFFHWSAEGLHSF